MNPRGPAATRSTLPLLSARPSTARRSSSTSDRATNYGLNPSASLVWNLLGEGLSAAQIAAALAGPPPAEAEAVVLGLVAELLKEGLIRPRADGEAPAASSVASPRPGGAPALGKPAITKYSDMQDLLLLDPIHEVADSGWPQKKPEPGAANGAQSPGAGRAKPAKR